MVLYFTGVAHTEELFYLFYPYVMKQLGIQLPASDSEDYKVTDRFTQMWTDFAKTGYRNFYIFLEFYKNFTRVSH